MYRGLSESVFVQIYYVYIYIKDIIKTHSQSMQYQIMCTLYSVLYLWRGEGTREREAKHAPNPAGRTELLCGKSRGAGATDQAQLVR